MTYAVKTLSEIIAAIQADATTRLVGADVPAPRSVIGALVRAQAGAEDDLNGYITWLAKQIPWDTADADLLVRWASIWGVFRIAPSAASGVATVTGSGLVAAGAAINRSDSVQYAVVADTTISGSGSVSVACLSVGATTNTGAGASMTFASPISGLASAVTVGPDGLSGGADIETVDALRARLLSRVREAPMGGSAADFKAWALSALSGVTRVWVLSGWLGTGTVGVTFVLDGRADPIPAATDLAIVQAAIDAVRPVAAQTTVFAPSAVPLNPAITLIPDSLAARQAVSDQLTTLLASSGTAEGGTIPLSQIRTAIGTAAGVVDYVMASPAADVVTARGRLPVLGAITWGATT